MNSWASQLWSTLGKKVIMAITGIAMVLFLGGHLLGNLLLLQGDPEPFNLYSHFLTSKGWLLIAVELILLAILLAHMVSAVAVTIQNRRSRPNRYHSYKSAGRSSKKSVASSSMIWTGIVLFVFLAVHIYTFKYGPAIAEGYVVEIEGERIRDLYRLVIEKFQNPLYTLGYVAAMVFMGFHLRHGFWSAFQSLGTYHPRYNRLLETLGYVVAVVLGVGFLAIPVWIFFLGGAS